MLLTPTPHGAPLPTGPPPAAPRSQPVVYAPAAVPVAHRHGASSGGEEGLLPGSGILPGSCGTLPPGSSNAIVNAALRPATSSSSTSPPLARPPPVPARVTVVPAPASLGAAPQPPGSAASHAAVSAATPPASAAAPTPPAPLGALPVPPGTAVPQDALFDYSRQLATRVAELEAEVANLRDERDTLRAENDAMGEHAYGLQRENGMLHSMGWNSMGEKADLEKRLEAAASEAATLRGALQQARSRSETVAQENAQLRASTDTLERERNNLQVAVQSLESQLKHAHAERDVRLSREAALSDRNAGHERMLVELRGEKQRLDELVSAQHIKIAEFQQIRIDLNTERKNKSHLAQQLDAAQMEITRLFQENGRLDHLVSTLHVEAANMRTQHDATMAEVPHLRDKLQYQAAGCVDMEANIAALHHTISELQKRNAELERAASQAAQEGHQHEKAAASLMEERAWLRQELGLSAARKREMEDRLNAMLGENSVVKAHLEVLGGERDQLHFRHQQLAAQTVALKGHADSLSRMAQGYKDESFTLQHKVQTLMEQKEGLEQTLQKPPVLTSLPPSVTGGAL